MSPNLPLIAWAPDADSTGPGVISAVSNMLPTRRGYAPDFGLADAQFTGATLPDACMGAATIKPGTGTPLLLLATSSKLYSYFSGALLDLTPAAPLVVAYYGVPFRFDAFGTVALAVQYANVLHASTNPSGGTDFAAVSGAPTANTMCVQSNFVMLGDTALTGGWAYSDGWWCSALGDHTDWTLDIATQCARGRLTQTPGGIVRMIAYQNDIIAFKGTSILRGSYVGVPTVWAWSVISTDVGIAGHDCAVQAEGLLYWLGPNGFYRFNGAGVERIASAPWEWFKADAGDYTNLVPTKAVWDPVRRVVRWHYPRAAELGNSVYGCIVYHVDTDRWGWTTTTAEWAMTLPSEFVPSVTSGTIRSTADVAAIVDSVTHSVQAYTGTPSESLLDTGDVGDDDAVSTLTKVRARFLSAPAAAFARHLYRMQLSDPLTLGAEVTRVDGKYDFSHASRWHRVSFSGTGMYEIAGFSVNAPASGKR